MQPTTPGKAREQARTKRRAGHRKHLAAVASGDTSLEVVVFPTAPLPAGMQPLPWNVCGCSYRPPEVDGRKVPQRLDPVWEFTEDPPPDRRQTRPALRKIVQRMLWGGKQGKIILPPLYPVGGFHSGDPRYEKPGFPDLILWPSARPMVRELKRMGKVPELAQATHMTSMHVAGWDVGLWRPCCLLSGRISAELARAAGTDLHPHDEYAGYRVRALPDIGPVRPAASRSAPAAAGVPLKPMPEPLAGDLAGQGAIGYLIDPGGTVTEAEGGDIGVLWRWLRAVGIAPVATTRPIMLVATDTRVHIRIRTPAGAAHRVAWIPVELDPDAFPVDVVERLARDRGSVVVASATDKVKWHLENRGV